MNIVVNLSWTLWEPFIFCAHCANITLKRQLNLSLTCPFCNKMNSKLLHHVSTNKLLEYQCRHRLKSSRRKIMVFGIMMPIDQMILVLTFGKGENFFGGEKWRRMQNFWRGSFGRWVKISFWIYRTVYVLTYSDFGKLIF